MVCSLFSESFPTSALALLLTAAFLLFTFATDSLLLLLCERFLP
jgi:hypothetical protein